MAADGAAYGLYLESKVLGRRHRTGVTGDLFQCIAVQNNDRIFALSLLHGLTLHVNLTDPVHGIPYLVLLHSALTSQVGNGTLNISVNLFLHSRLLLYL